jgi:abortive infection bacteriophage resistance protein
MAQFNFPILNGKQLYQKLKEKWLILDVPEADVIHFFDHHSYFQLVMYFQYYWKANEQWEKVFRDGITISKILDDYNFDHELRILLFSQVIHIENSFKNIFCQATCQAIWTTWWTDTNHFIDAKVYEDNIKPVIAEIDKWEYKRSEFIKRYFDKYDDPKYPPFWNMIEVFTFGQIAKMYKFLASSAIKKEVSRMYHLDDYKFANWIKIVVDIRNMCCHHSKMIDKKFTIARVHKIDAMIDGKYDSLYHWCTLIYYFLKIIKPQNDFKEQVLELIKKYHIVNHWFSSNIDTLWN